MTDIRTDIYMMILTSFLDEQIRYIKYDVVYVNI